MTISASWTRSLRMQPPRMRLRPGPGARYIALVAILTTAGFVIQGSGVFRISSSSTAEAGVGSGGGPMSSPGPGVGPAWAELHAHFVAEIAASEQQAVTTAKGDGKGIKSFQVLFYGGSIVESWRGTAMGATVDRAKGVPSMWGRHFGQPYKAQAFGITNDETGHVLWRLRNGELPRKQPPEVVVLLVGGHDLELAHAAQGDEFIVETAGAIASRVDSMLQFIVQKHPITQVILLALLPRGVPTADGSIPWPSKYSRGLLATNARYEAIAAMHQRVQYIDCGEAFLVAAPEGGRNIDQRIIPDGVHPNAEGMDNLGLCLDPTVAYLRSHPNAGEADSFVDEEDDVTMPDPGDSTLAEQESSAMHQIAAVNEAAAAAAVASAAAAAAVASGAAAAAAEAVVAPSPIAVSVADTRAAMNDPPLAAAVPQLESIQPAGLAVPSENAAVSVDPLPPDTVASTAAGVSVVSPATDASGLISTAAQRVPTTAIESLPVQLASEVEAAESASLPKQEAALVTPALLTPALVTPALVTPTLVTPALVTPVMVTPALVTPAPIGAVVPLEVVPVERGTVQASPDIVIPQPVEAAAIDVAPVVIVHPVEILPARVQGAEAHAHTVATSEGVGKPVQADAAVVVAAAVATATEPAESATASAAVLAAAI